jgi:outer membrane lipoprotein-sorting protein
MRAAHLGLLGWMWVGLPVQALGAPEAAAETLPDATEVLRVIDDNLTFASRTATVRMTVATARRTRTYEMKMFGRGTDQAAVEYLAPSRDKGTRMLRMADDVWTYLPSVERTQKISGQMLRQGLMGSDMSYDDLMGASKLRDIYQAEVVAAEQVGDIPVWKLELVAKEPSVAYPKRTAWVAKDSGIPLKQELYAVSGMLLKTWTMTDVKDFEGGRRFPTKMVITDALREGSMTTIELLDMTFGVELDDEVFSRRWLERR